MHDHSRNHEVFLGYEKKCYYSIGTSVKSAVAVSETSQ